MRRFDPTRLIMGGRIDWIPNQLIADKGAGHRWLRDAGSAPSFRMRVMPAGLGGIKFSRPSTSGRILGLSMAMLDPYGGKRNSNLRLRDEVNYSPLRVRQTSSNLEGSRYYF